MPNQGPPTKQPFLDDVTAAPGAVRFLEVVPEIGWKLAERGGLEISEADVRLMVGAAEDGQGFKGADGVKRVLVPYGRIAVVELG